MPLTNHATPNINKLNMTVTIKTFIFIVFCHCCSDEFPSTETRMRRKTLQPHTMFLPAGSVLVPNLQDIRDRRKRRTDMVGGIRNVLMHQYRAHTGRAAAFHVRDRVIPNHIMDVRRTSQPFCIREKLRSRFIVTRARRNGAAVYKICKPQCAHKVRQFRKIVRKNIIFISQRPAACKRADCVRYRQ